MSKKHVKNFTELFENLTEESTDDLIVLAESGIIQWNEAIDTIFDRGEMAVCYWIQTASMHMQPVAVFNNDRVLYLGTTYDGTQTIEELAYMSGAKIVMGTSNFRAINYDNDEKSVVLPKYSTDRVRSITTETLKKLGRPQA